MINKNMPNPVDFEKQKKEPAGIEDIFDMGRSETSAVPEVHEAPREAQHESAPEVRPEQAAEAAPEGEDAQRKYTPPPAQESLQQAAPIQKSPELVKIETILSEHLDEIFTQMTPAQQMQFKQKGEETATKIEKLLQDVKVKVKEMLNLLREWLRIIPGVNKFFIEQEAKIKTDRILNLHEQKHKQK